jgi:hypothetical protein
MVYDEIDAVVALHKMKIEYLLTENGLFRKKFEISV